MTEPMPALEVVEANLEDQRHVVDLHAMLKEFSEHPVTGPSPLRFDDPQTLADALLGSPSSVSFLAYDQGKAVGFAICFVLLETFEAKPAMYVNDLMTTESHRGKGVGLLLLDKIESVARQRGCVGIDLGVVEGNEPAKRLYALHGFAPAIYNRDLGVEQHWSKHFDAPQKKR